MFDAKSLLNMIMGAGQQGQGGLAGMAGQVLSGLQGMGKQAGDAATQAAGKAQGALGDMEGLKAQAGSIFGQATQGVQEAAAKVNASTGVGGMLEGAISQATGGQSSADLLARAKGMIGENQMAAGALAGGLGALLLGTKTGRGLATNAAALGGLALIGGLAYKAFNNYQAGKPLLDSQSEPVAAAPAGSGYGEHVSDQQAAALTMIRSMIAAAAADGVIDDTERKVILGAVHNAGLDDAAKEFLANEFANPADVETLVGMSENAESAQQIYAAARVAIDPDTQAEKDFLARLAGGLELDAQHVAHIDAAAAGLKHAA